MTELRSRINVVRIQRTISQRFGLSWGCLDESLTIPMGRMLGGSYALESTAADPEFEMMLAGVSMNTLPALGEPNETETVAWGGGSIAAERQHDSSDVCVRGMSRCVSIEYG